MATTTVTCIALLAVLFVNVRCEEPKCSPYDYDEKLLEKMIRMEIAFEKILHEVKTTKHEVKTEMDNIREERTQLKEEVSVQKHGLDETIRENLATTRETFEMYESQIKRMSEDLMTFQNQSLMELKEEVSVQKHGLDETIRENLATNRETFEMYESQIKRMSDDLMTFQNQSLMELKGLLPETVPRVEFRAHGIADTTPKDGQVMIFPTVDFNHGQAYDPKTGYFTAPVAGTYLLTIQICLRSNQFMYFGIVVDGAIQNTFQASAESRYFCTSFMAIVNMEIGSKAWLSSRRTVESNIFLTDWHHWSGFSGVLINKNS